MPVTIIMLGLALAAGAADAKQPAVAPSACMPDVGDYTYMWWANGWRSPRRVLAFQGGHWGMALDVPAVKLMHFGAIARPATAEEALAGDNAAILSLPKATLALKIRAGGVWYTCSAGPKASRLIESGRFVQRADLENLVFQDEAGRKLDAVSRLEIVAWPDRVSFLLEATPIKAQAKAALAVEVSAGGLTYRAEQPESSWPAQAAQQVALVLAAPSAPAGRWRKVEAENSPQPGPAGPDVSAAAPLPTATVEVREMKTGQPAAVTFDEARQWYRIALPPQAWIEKDRTDRLDRLMVRLRNPGGQRRTFRLLFADDDGVPAITGLTPMLRDTAGMPTGIPVQISKNWHRKPDQAFLYQGPWLHAFTLLHVPAGASVDCELTITRAWWGGLPAVSHAQLCLIGWGTNQLWDEAAIGAWGESICYDPDVNLGRGMIDDVRPLMVWGMGGRPKVMWSWTQNVGGGDFADYHPAGPREFMARMRTRYRQYGPCLTDVTYVGVSPDGAFSMRATASSPRCDDITRGYYHVRYDFHKAISPERLELFRLGADRYNDPAASKVAWGAWDSVTQETAAASREGYQTTFPLAPEGGWISLHGTAGYTPKQGGAWANRGIILRSWKARIGGAPAAAPRGAIIGTSQGKHASAALIAPGKDFLPGDRIEFVVEMVILPVRADDYYGPNENLRASLKATGDTWKPVARQAAGNTLQLKALSGSPARLYPPEVKVDTAQKAALEITGGVGYVPLTFSGLKTHSGYGLFLAVDGKETRVDQAVYGNDFWQCDYDEVSRTWRQTYNVNLDAPNDQRQSKTFLFRPASQPAEAGRRG